MNQLTLLFQQEGHTEKLVLVDKDVFIIGRLPECDMVLPFEGISRNHARIVKSADHVWTIQDLGSKNGTQVNQYLITDIQELANNDVISLGKIKLLVKFKNINTNSTTNRFLRKVNTQPQKIIFRNVEQLQQHWISANTINSNNNNQNETIARLKDLVDIAKNLCAAASIEEIFFQVQQVVFRYLDSIDRLALLVKIDDSGNLELISSATRNISEQENLATDGSWISRSICQKVFAEKIAIQSADTQSDQRFSREKSILAKGIRSAMAVPLWDEHKVIGVLYADASLSSSHWESEGEEELSFFSALANIVASSVQRSLLVDKLKNEEVIRHRLERYHSPAVVQQLIAVGGSPNGRLAPRENEISILFADLVGFTAISERLTPREIAQLLNNLFEEMLKEVFLHSGTLDKYIGDCIMAFFGAPDPDPGHADRAVASAKGMLTRLKHLNANNFWQEPLQLRIAINSGKAVVGDVGSSQRVDYTALGTTINLAARMETSCSPGECVISEVTYNMLSEKSDFFDIGAYRFKGIDRSINLYQTKMCEL
ncbi:FHA domain-containing protein [Dolichospermum sp. LEGE 00240]|jgi:adenylate cyclase|uniref:adenylate/guanylate cyclase domain-containing protein n=1 Tax=Dolichospermum sp. LEGE 00240 TaxID=1828603 RepID=UPI00187E4A6E|nr:adenylate/guanylate cyclase domain-containing protein [Dolichospermum sp. LEGE 00240]MDM3844064.1 adenylate/guanylate cyclase domain-containing protein [Aphanizomenon gracile PMC638.10]MDM3853261.1 adenylate/guanylate cyclase domain-containing protein [Aphanizomenon gracile PMC627.10]MDM3854554.1 adenylate/guanylate cyclase domain-containing protein [Aphanizomenon gracile PMC649.10]MDM3862436.1 adenylate/guanylate cyclase domain-containing protein [Aphanizomenon gracile PMC644.10]MBE9251395